MSKLEKLENVNKLRDLLIKKERLLSLKKDTVDYHFKSGSVKFYIDRGYKEPGAHEIAFEQKLLIDYINAELDFVQSEIEILITT